MSRGMLGVKGFSSLQRTANPVIVSREINHNSQGARGWPGSCCLQGPGPSCGCAALALPVWRPPTAPLGEPPMMLEHPAPRQQCHLVKPSSCAQQVARSACMPCSSAVRCAGALQQCMDMRAPENRPRHHCVLRLACAGSHRVESALEGPSNAELASSL